MIAMQEKLVSIIMNCYNGEKYLKETIDSVISQTYQNWEIIFWDNQSSDESKNICLSYNDNRIKYFYSNIHTNLYSARNSALIKSSGEYIAFLDTDDLWHANKLQFQIEFFSDPQIGIVCSNFIFLNEMNNKIKNWHKKDIKSGWVLDELLKDYFIGMPTVVIRKESILNIKKPFNANFNIIGDFDLFTRICQNWKLQYIHKTLATYRWHGKNLAFIETDREIIELKEWFLSIKYLKPIYLSKNLHFIKEKLNYLRAKEHLRNNDILKSMKCLFIINNFSLVFRLLIQIIFPKKIIKIISLFKFR